MDPTTTATRRPIVVGVDGSPASLDAVRWAAREAVRGDLPLRLLHACDLPPVNPHIAASPPYGVVWAESGRRWLSDAAELAATEAPGVEVDWDVHFGPAADTIVDETADAALAVVGSRGFGSVRRLFAGSVAVAVSTHASCPVVVVREGTAAAGNGHVVVGADGSALSEAALGYAFETAAAHGVRLIAVRAWRDPWSDAPWAGLPSQGELDELERKETQSLHSDLAAWRTKFGEVEVSELVVRAGRAAEALLEAAAHARLLVVGSHGHGVVAGTLLGSTGQALLHAATCPVAIVRPRG
ncbi:universal stress protein [Prauserella muralis]|uniref:Uncharacterized protein n=1 Tax=Prauserella muralis TaxID=588067 RepID=A0A2V4AQL2_9PSEU|nr:universal stress protein [Prauserella muralis]PXY22314.1 hypothetical protein BAY60_20795 [Prauserella muralis]TWE27963.1 nucleotide-binding universal stress UspA family protein [Prauserella muralis]